MTPEEIGDVLGLAAARDRRTVGESDILAWLGDLDGITFDEAREAIRRHYRQTDDWLMPSHVLQHVRVIREEQRRAARRNRPALPGPYADDSDARAAHHARGRAMCEAEIIARRAARGSHTDTEGVIAA